MICDEKGFNLNVILVSHESDVDGIISAAIALQRYPQAKLFFTSYGKENFKKICDEVYQEVLVLSGKGLIIFSDLGLNEDSIKVISELFNFLQSNAWEIIWIDHHPWSNNATDLFNNGNESRRLYLDTSMTKCASELVYRILMPGNNRSKMLASIAHTSDFLSKDQTYPPLPELITYYKNIPSFYLKLAELTLKISNGTLWDTTMQEEFMDYCKYRDEAKITAIKKMETKILKNGMTMGVIPSSPYIQVSLFSEEIFRSSKLDIVFFLGEDGKVSIRRNNPVIKCDKIASRLLEGGGHEYAAGGRISTDPTNIKLAFKELEKAAEQN